ncbi:CKB_collapsed_G0008860.mRNA.1.CDS.1 [Saccharomyces cerevisiae]|nr:CKB_collapsed_G0008860.mRNA.1.CDS.1 [Saccharomyces cerevisiae]
MSNHSEILERPETPYDITYRVGVAENKNSKFRRTMEDVHTKNILADETRDVRDVLNDSFLAIDEEINTKLVGNSGCTAAVCVLRWELPDSVSDDSMDLAQHQRKLYTANVGDSRIVLFRNGNSIRLTYDHKASDTLEMQRVEQAGGLIMKSRVNGMLAVTRSLGDKFFDSLVVGSPFTTSVEITSEDKFLILACDGLWDVIDDQDACELIKDITEPNEAAKVLRMHNTVYKSIVNNRKTKLYIEAAEV